MKTSPEIHGSLGLIPLSLFCATSLSDINRGMPGDILWMCNVSNLMLSLGLIGNRAGLIRLAVIWIIPGLGLWIYGAAMGEEVSLISYISHLGGFSVGVIALFQVRAARNTWVYGILWYLLLQQLSRWFTPVSLNVNIAHAVREEWTGVFTSYWQYWLFNAVLAIFTLWIVGFILGKLFPPLPPGGQAPQET